MNEFEKAYIIFFWLLYNISYDKDNKRTGKAAYMPFDFYNKGKCTCEGYSKLFQYICQEIGIKIIYISSYAPDEDYVNLNKYENHARNILKVNQKNYLIDVTLGDNSSSKNKNEKNLCEFYFCSNPEYFIFTHLPRESKWQLLESTLGTEEFQKRVKFRDTFFEYFIGSNVLHNIIITKNEYTIRLYKKYPEVNILVTILEKNDDDYTFSDDSEEMVIDTEKYIDIKCIFPKKNIYKLKISVNDDKINNNIKEYTKTYIKTVENKIEYLDDAEKDFRYGELNNKESLEHDEIMASLNKDKINLIISKAPNREKSSLNNFIEYLKIETKELNEF